MIDCMIIKMIILTVSKILFTHTHRNIIFQRVYFLPVDVATGEAGV